ncbi:MAG: tryptophan synthase subunit alpha [Luteibaculum sp.]
MSKLGIYFTSGFPALDSTAEILEALCESEVDFIEVGVPFSDPLADGPVIQESSKKALENGINLSTILKELGDFTSKHKQVPQLYLMGYYNSFLQFGMEKLLKSCREKGVYGLIIPDLPVSYYKRNYQGLFEQYGIKPVFFVSPESTEEHLEEIAALNPGFVYVLSSNSTTGGNTTIDSSLESYYDRIKAWNCAAPKYLGFGIKSSQDVREAGKYFNGAIVGTAFIQMLNNNYNQSVSRQSIANFITGLKAKN